MKKILITAVLTAAPMSVYAQSYGQMSFDTEVFRMSAPIIAMGLLMLFILAFLKRILDHRLKNKIVEKDIPENVIASLLKNDPQENRNINVKWFAILAGTGVGLTIVSYTLPLGIHSLAIMAFSISAGFLGYFFFLKKSENESL